MRKTRLKLAIAAVLLIALAAPGLAVAYFTDYEEADGGAVLNLEGETHINEKPEDAKKTISIENTGDTDVIVRVAVHGEYLKPIKYEGEDWQPDDDGEWYYYKKILHPGDSTSEIVAEIDTEAAGEKDQEFEIIVVHESERVTYDGTQENRVVKPDGWILPDIAVGSEEVGD